MSCEHCTDPDGFGCFPIYGVGPHKHVGNTMIGSTVVLPAEQWPENYQEDPDYPGLGVWWCPYCGDGKPAPEPAPDPTAVLAKAARDAHAALDAAGKAWYAYAGMLDVGPDRTRAFAVYENIHNARRI